MSRARDCGVKLLQSALQLQTYASTESRLGASATAPQPGGSSVGKYLERGHTVELTAHACCSRLLLRYRLARPRVASLSAGGRGGAVVRREERLRAQLVQERHAVVHDLHTASSC